MNTPQIIEQNGARVLTTQQLAEFYGTDSRRISENFNRNKDRFKEGKHFILLQGEELKLFGDQYANCVSVDRVSKVYLWTEKGAWLHAKSLNTDEAWEAYEMLVDSYYDLKPKSQAELTLMIANQLVTQEKRIDSLEQKVNEEITLNHGQQQTLHHAIQKRIQSIKNDYEVPVNKLYSQLHSHLRRAFAVPRYIFVKRNDYNEAISWVKSWRPLL